MLDATGVDQAVLVGLSVGGRHALQLAAWYPERAAGVVAIGAALPWPLPPDFDEPKDSYEGWGKANRHYWLADYRGWVEFFMSQVFTEPQTTKQREDGVAWGLETSAETLLLTTQGVAEVTAADAEAVCRQVRCPVLIVHGDQDGIVPYETGMALARWTGGQLVTIRGGGHAPTLRDPVQVATFSSGISPIPRPSPRSDREPGPAPATAASGSTSPRPSGSVMLAVTWPSPTSYARSARSWRCTGWPSIRSPSC